MPKFRANLVVDVGGDKAADGSEMCGHAELKIFEVRQRLECRRIEGGRLAQNFQIGSHVPTWVRVVEQKWDRIFDLAQKDGGRDSSRKFVRRKFGHIPSFTPNVETCKARVFLPLTLRASGHGCHDDSIA